MPEYDETPRTEDERDDASTVLTADDLAGLGEDSPAVDTPPSPSGDAGVEDPVAELRAALRFAPGDWFVVHSYAGYENKVKTNLETRITSLDM